MTALPWLSLTLLVLAAVLISLTDDGPTRVAFLVIGGVFGALGVIFGLLSLLWFATS